MYPVLVVVAGLALIQSVLLGLAIGLGAVLHWMLPTIDFGMASLIGMVGVLGMIHILLTVRPLTKSDEEDLDPGRLRELAVHYAIRAERIEKRRPKSRRPDE